MRIFPAVLLFALLAACTAPAPPQPRVVLVGEVHDNPDHHARQAALAARYEPRALVFEMIPATREAEVNRLRASGAARPEIAKALDWERSGWPDFGFYAPIWEAAPKARLYGAEVPRRALMSLASPTPDPDLINAQARLPPLAPALQSALEAELEAAHCGMLPPEALPMMATAQRLRDLSLAEATLRALRETGGPVMVIAGNGHVRRDRGVPALLAREIDPAGMLVIGQGEAATPDAPYDDWQVAPSRPRPDPCAAFRSGG